MLHHEFVIYLITTSNTLVCVLDNIVRNTDERHHRHIMPVYGHDYLVRTVIPDVVFIFRYKLISHIADYTRIDFWSGFGPFLSDA